MKRFALFFILLFTVAIQLHADSNVRVIVLDGKDGYHSEYYPTADMPEVYFDVDNLEIIIVADGFASYYNVNIVSQSTQLAVISTQVDGYGDTIDVSTLPDDDYTIIITSSNNNEYEGQFTNKTNRYRRRNY